MTLAIDILLGCMAALFVGVMLLPGRRKRQTPEMFTNARWRGMTERKRWAEKDWNTR